eukprot:5505131-Karenia_brevis.AAC.2
MENQILGYGTKKDWPKCLREADGIPEKIKTEPHTIRPEINTPAFLTVQDVTHASSSDGLSDSSSDARPACSRQTREPEEIPDWTNECGMLVLKNKQVADQFFVDTLFHWGIMEEKFSRDELLDAAFVPYKEFYQFDYCSTHEPWLH